MEPTSDYIDQDHVLEKEGIKYIQTHKYFQHKRLYAYFLSHIELNKKLYMSNLVDESGIVHYSCVHECLIVYSTVPKSNSVSQQTQRKISSK